MVMDECEFSFLQADQQQQQEEEVKKGEITGGKTLMRTYANEAGNVKLA